jgi:hypothetical protein
MNEQNITRSLIGPLLFVIGESCVEVELIETAILLEASSNDILETTNVQ